MQQKGPAGSLPPAVPLAITPMFRPCTHTSDDSYIYQLSLVVATATVSFSSNFSNSSSAIASFPLPSASAICVKLCLTDRVWVNRPTRTSNHERLYIHETAATHSVTLAVVVTRTSLCNDCRAVRVSLPEPVLGLLFFVWVGDVALVHTYLNIRILGAG